MSQTGARTSIVDELGQCGYEDTQSGDPCEQPAYYTDGRCGWHTESDERKQQQRDRPGHVQFRLHKPAHNRLTFHNRDSETLAGTIERALDALEREQELPDAVREALHTDE